VRTSFISGMSYLSLLLLYILDIYSNAFTERSTMFTRQAMQRSLDIASIKEHMHSRMMAMLRRKTSTRMKMDRMTLRAKKHVGGLMISRTVKTSLASKTYCIKGY
jgi:hypothetical protein